MNIDAVVKIGGSLIKEPSNFRLLLKELSTLALSHVILVVPGGGELADLIRTLDQHFKLKAETSHRMALFTQDILAFLISDLLENAVLVNDLDALPEDLGVLYIFQPAKLVIEEDTLPNSWSVTSDSVAAWIATKVQASQLILIKDIDGLFQKDPKKDPTTPFISKISTRELEAWEGISCVDDYLPQVLTVPCYIVNGKHPDRIRAILSGLPTRTTTILPSSNR